MLLSAHLLQCFQPHLEEVAHSRGHTLLACKPVLGSAKLCVGCRPCKQREVRRAAQQPLLCCRDRRSWEQGCSAAAAVSSTQEAELSFHAAAVTPREEEPLSPATTRRPFTHITAHRVFTVSLGSLHSWHSAQPVASTLRGVGGPFKCRGRPTVLHCPHPSHRWIIGAFQDLLVLYEARSGKACK